jgi:pimeloyl-ACP methyl ester carboxylesterase
LAALVSVVALDLRGWGSGAPGADGELDWENFVADSSLQLGRPLLGQRMKDLLAIPATRIGRRSWTLVGVGDAALVAAQAAAIDDRVDRLITVNGLLSFHEAIDDPLTAHPMSSFPPGIIGEYDVRDIYAAVGPRPFPRRRSRPPAQRRKRPPAPPRR